MIKWWGRMKEKYGSLDGKDAFKMGMMDGKLIASSDVKVEKKLSQKRLKKLAKKNRKK